MTQDTMTRSILMGEFPLAFAGLENFLEQGQQLRLFEGEQLEHAIIDRQFLFYVQQGQMACEISRPDDSTFRFLTMGKGITMFANAITPYTKYSQSWDVVALQNTVLIAFSRETVHDLLLIHPPLASAFLDYTSQYHTIMQKRTLLTANLTSSQRVLTWLYALCECETKGQNEYLLPCKLNQQEIADILILHISTCNKMFGWLQSNGVIEKSREQIRVNFPALQQHIAEDWKIY